MADAFTEEWSSPDFEGDDNARARAMIKIADALDLDALECLRRDSNLALARMYENQPIASLMLYAGNYFANGAVTYPSFNTDDASTWNVARSVVQTAASMVGRSRPRGLVLTTGETVQVIEAAEQATQFLDGWAADVDLYPTTFEILVDCMRFDSGWIQVYEEGKRVRVQRVLASEVRADPLDTMYGTTRRLYRRRFVSKQALLAQFGKGKPELRETIKNAKTIDPLGLSLTAGLVRVEESWSRPSVPGGNDGIHLIAIDEDNGCLFKEVWKKNYIPLIPLVYEKGATGITGISLMMQLAPMQTRLNRVLDRIDKCQRLVAVPRLAVKRGSKIVKTTISNLIGQQVEYTDAPPTPINWQAVPPELYQWAETITQKMYDIPGIDRGQSHGTKPEGADSGAAIRESLDIQQTRLQPFAQKWEGFHVKIFEIALDMIADIVADDKSYEVDVPGSGLLTKRDWSDIGLAAGQYKLQVAPVNQLPMTPTGRLSYVTDRLKAGLWDMDQARAALDDLDIKKASDLNDAPFRHISRCYEDMIYRGIAHQPSTVAVGSYQLAVKLGLQYLAFGLDKDVASKNIDLVERYLDQLRNANAAITQPANGANGVSAPTNGANIPGPVEAPPAGGAPLSPIAPAFAPTT
jgi:hypothetical protein